MKLANIVAFALSCTVAFSLGGMAGGWTDVQDPTTIQNEISFAANHIVTSNADYVLHYANLVSAKKQLVAGTNYELDMDFDVISSKTGQNPVPLSVVYRIVVFKDLNGQLSVTSMNKISQQNPCAPGAPCPHSTSDPWAIKAAQVGVDAIGKQLGTAVTLSKIISVKTQVVAGVNYVLVIEVSGGGQNAVFDVTVYRDLKNNLQVLPGSIQQEHSGSILAPGPVIGGTGLGQQTQPNLLGGYRPVDMSDQQMADVVVAAAKFALDKISQDIGRPLTYLGVTNAAQQVVAGLNLRFDVEGGTNPGSRVYQAQVFVPLSSGVSNKFELKSYGQTAASLPR